MNRSVYVGLTIALISLLLACGSALFSGEPTPSSVADAQPTSEPIEQVERTNEQEANPPAQLVEDLKSVVSSKTGIPSYEIMFVSAEAVEWLDACLGASNPDEFCAQVITPGYRITLSTMTEEYVFHTDRTGDSIRLTKEQ